MILEPNLNEVEPDMPYTHSYTILYTHLLQPIYTPYTHAQYYMNAAPPMIYPIISLE